MIASHIAPRKGAARRRRPSRAKAWNVDWSLVTATSEEKPADVMSLRLQDRSRRAISGYSFEGTTRGAKRDRGDLGPEELDFLPRHPGDARGRLHAHVADVRPRGRRRVLEHLVVHRVGRERVLEIPWVARR